MPQRLKLRSFTPLVLALLAGSAGCAGPNALRGHADAPAPDPLENVEGRTLFAEGEALAQRGDFVRAEQYLAASIRRGYPAGKALPLLLRVCISSSRLGAALQHATPYLQLHPNDHRLRWLVASVLLGLGRYDDARQELLRVLRDAPGRAEAHYMLGVLLRDHYRDPDAAAVEFAAYQRLAADGLHGAEVAAWLRERTAGTAVPDDRNPIPVPIPSQSPDPVPDPNPVPNPNPVPDPNPTPTPNPGLSP